MEAIDLESVDETLFESLGFGHPLIVLMPYPATAPSPLLALQAKVWQVLSPGLPYVERLTVALGTRGAIGNLGLTLKEAALVAIDLLTGLNKLLLSPAVLEQITWAYLDRDGIGLEDRKFSSPPHHPLPSLVRVDSASGKAVLAGRLVEQSRAPDIWTNVSMELSGKSSQDLAMMCPADLRASLRMLILFLMHAEVDRFRATRSERLDRLEDMGLSLWNCLLAQLRKTPEYRPEADERHFGPTIQNAMWHFLRSKELARPTVGASVSAPTQRLPTPATASTHVVVRTEIPPGANDDDRQALARYECLRQPLPVARLPEVAGINALEATLASEFPWAECAVTAIADDLRSRRLFGSVEVGMAPTLLVGRPGCGKSRLARRVAEELAVPFLPLSLAGMGDSRAILGTARGWSSGDASPLVRLLANRSSASAIVMLDELDKAHSGTRNDVPPTSALLNLLEIENAKCWYDTFLQTACDLSKLMYIATANSLSSIPKPLLSRLRIIVVSEPRESDFSGIARGALIDIAQEWGLPPTTLKHLADAVPIGAARNAREIRALVRGYLSDWARQNLGPKRTH